MAAGPFFAVVTGEAPSFTLVAMIRCRKAGGASPLTGLCPFCGVLSGAEFGHELFHRVTLGSMTVNGSITGTGVKDKVAVMGVLERGGQVRTSVLPNRKKHAIQTEVHKHVEAGSAHTPMP